MTFTIKPTIGMSERCIQGDRYPTPHVQWVGVPSFGCPPRPIVHPPIFVPTEQVSLFVETPDHRSIDVVNMIWKTQCGQGLSSLRKAFF